MAQEIDMSRVVWQVESTQDEPMLKVGYCQADPGGDYNRYHVIIAEGYRLWDEERGDDYEEWSYRMSVAVWPWPRVTIEVRDAARKIGLDI